MQDNVFMDSMCGIKNAEDADKGHHLKPTTDYDRLFDDEDGVPASGKFEYLISYESLEEYDAQWINVVGFHPEDFRPVVFRSHKLDLTN